MSRHQGLQYVEGGNPPHMPAMLLDGQVIAWWPAIGVPDQQAASLVLMAYEAKGSTLSRKEVRDLLEERPDD